MLQVAIVRGVAGVCTALGLAALATGCVFDNGGADLGRDAASPADAGPDAAPDATPGVADEVLDGLDPAALDGVENATAWARLASAPQVAFTAYLPASQADQNRRAGELCPLAVVLGEVTSFTGGCTTLAGETWFGSATVEGPLVDGFPVSVSYEDFGHTGTTQCGGAELSTETRYTGSVLRGSPAVALPIRVDLKLTDHRPTTACVLETVPIGVSYELEVVTTDAAQTWNGQGRVGKAGGDRPGVVSATTTDEITSELCDSEALSGTTVITAAGHELEITYDGATDCSDRSTVQARYDGVALAPLTGVSCAVRPGAPVTGWRAAALVLAVLAGGLAAARRRPRLG